MLRAGPFALASIMLFAAAPAGANAPAMPLAYVERPLTVPQFTIAPAFLFVGLGEDRGLTSANQWGLALGATLGLLDDLELAVVALPALLSPQVRVLNPSLTLTARFLRGALELGLQSTITIPARSGTQLDLSLGVPLLIHFGSAARLDSGLLFEINAIDPEVHYVFSVPLELSFQMIDLLALRLATGVIIPKETDVTRMPLGFALVFAVPGPDRAPIIDIIPEFRFTTFLVPGSRGDVVVPGNWLFTTAIRAYFFL